MDVSVIEEVRLRAFKSFFDASLRLDDLTLLIGRNGSGKSNALDGLSVLSRMATGDDIRDAIDGGPVVRGGVDGCVPAGHHHFWLGCSVRTGDDVVALDVSVQAAPSVQIANETLSLNGEPMLRTEQPDPDSGDIRVRYSGMRDDSPGIPFKASRLLSAQVVARIPATGDGRRVHLAASQMINALRGVFVLDPVPSLMRQYVRERDTELRRNGDNLSAAVASVIADPEQKWVLVEALRRLNEHGVDDLSVETTRAGDVMLNLVEKVGGRSTELPIRLASDGTLRFLAVLTALLQAPKRSAPMQLAADDAVGATTLVIEELENGLHASQAAAMIGLIRHEVERRQIRTLATVHSPAMLDALTGAEHERVVVCQRDADGTSRLRRLVELDSYFKVVTSGTLGRAAVDDRLRSSADSAPEPVSSFLDDLLAG
jgi:predicted ATPase